MEPLTDEVKKALERADTIVICLSSGDLKRCSEYEEDFFAFELQTALDLSDRGKPIVVLLHNTEMRTLLGKTIVSGMDHLHNGLGSRLKERLEKFRRYIIDFGVPDDNFEAILDRICAKRRK